MSVKPVIAVLPCRVDWMLMYQGMVVLAASQVWWTWEVEDVFNKVRLGDKQAMKNYGKKMHEQIDELVKRISLMLTKNERKKYNTVLIIDVHARDIVDSFIRGRWLSPWDTGMLGCFVLLWSVQLRPLPSLPLPTQHPRGPGVRMGKPAALLLGP